MSDAIQLEETVARVTGRTRRIQLLVGVLCLGGLALMIAAGVSDPEVKQKSGLKVGLILLSLLFLGVSVIMFYSAFVKTPALQLKLLDAIANRPNEIVSAQHHWVAARVAPAGKSEFPIGAQHWLRVQLADKTKVNMGCKIDDLRAILAIIWERAPHSRRETTSQRT